MGTNLRWRLVRLGAAAAALALTAAAQEPLVRTGQHFVVHFHSSKLPGALAAHLADDALAAAESTWPAIDKLLGLRSFAAPTLHVYAEPDQFRALEQQHRAGLVPLESFALPREAHVLLWPQLSQKALEITGLPDTTRQAIVKRSAQLAAAAHTKNAVDDPWLAEVFAYAVLEGIVNPKHEFGIEPAYDSRRLVLHYDFEERNPHELHATILDFSEPKTQREFEVQVENKCIMAQMMAATGDTWAKKLLGSTPKKDSPRAVTRVDAVEKVLGTKWLRTESAFSKLCQKVKPVWRESAPMAALRGGRLLVVGDPDRAAQFHALLPPPDGAYAIRGTFEVKPCNEDSFRLQLDWDEKSMIGCWFGVGRVRVERWKVGGDWEMLAEGKAPIVAGVPFEGAVEVGDTVRLLVDGHEYCAWARGDRKMHGLWSFGVNDCVTFVEKLRIEPLGSAKK